jgi:hypothetical protein
VQQHLAALLDSARIRAAPQVVVSEQVCEAIQRTSHAAAIVLMGFEAPEEGFEESFYQSMEHWAGDLPRVVFVDSVGGMSLES